MRMVRGWRGGRKEARGRKAVERTGDGLMGGRCRGREQHCQCRSLALRRCEQ
jgi:hypothetical protein